MMTGSTTCFRIRAARRAAGYRTSKSFADKYNIPATTYSQHETGSRMPGDEALALYSKLFSVNLEWLKSGKGEAYSKDSNLDRHKLDDELIPLDLVTRKAQLAIKPSEIDEALLEEILSHLLDFIKNKEKPLATSRIASIAAGLYTDIYNESIDPETQTRMIKSTIKTLLRLF